ncbi:MAG: LamG domain-containing protein [Ignavibacteria bacterium]|nr:LamG domain-containing protein [Ignavibacteria bacterium]MBI3766258.1 LamG domain-containing protein [Ignavibacteriales bacterium]
MKQFRILSIIVLVLIGFSCKDNVTIITPTQSNQLGKIAMSFASAPAGITRIVAKLTRDGFEARTLELTISDSGQSASGLFSDVSIGIWHLKVDALDDSGGVRFTGETDVEVLPDQTSTVELQLLPANSSILIHVTWGTTCTPTPQDIVSWWPADGNPTDILSGYDAGLHGGMGFQTGRVRMAFSFDSADGYLRVQADTITDFSSFTIEAWILPATPFPDDNYHSIPIFEFNDESNTEVSLGVHFWHSQPIRFSGTGPGCLFANLRDTENKDHWIVSDANVLRGNSWNHAALTYDHTSGVTRLYHDGKIVAQEDLGIFLPRMNIPLFFGVRPPSGPHAVGHFSGAMDEVTLYKRALSAAELYSIYAAGSAGKCRWR